MLINSNNRPIKLLGVGSVSRDIQQFLLVENIESSPCSFEQACSTDDADSFQYIVAVAKDQDLRCRIIQWLIGNRLHCPSFIHSASVVAAPNRVGQGSVIWPMSSVLEADLGDFNTIAPNAHVGHQARLGSNCVLLPGAMTLGTTEIADHALLQTGAVVLDGRKISAPNVILLPRSLVNKDINVSGVYGGSPCRKIAATGVSD